MITREEAKIMYPSFEDGNVCPSDVDKLIDKLFDQFESQLSSNPLQLTCEGCVEKDNWKFNYYPMQCEYCELKPRKCYYTAKDTK